MNGPNLASGYIKAFRIFTLKVRSLIGILEKLGRKGTFELQCGSHVSRLLGKLPHDLRSSFRCFAHPHQVPIPTLLDLSEWLEYEIQVQEDTSRFVLLQTSLLPGPVLDPPLLAVMFRFRVNSVAISSGIQGMFPQIRLLPEDRPLDHGWHQRSSNQFHAWSSAPHWPEHRSLK